MLQAQGNELAMEEYKMGKIVSKTSMNEMPKNCLDCKQVFCKLPLKRRTEYAMLKKYENKRHAECPLVEIELEDEQHGEN